MLTGIQELGDPFAGALEARKFVALHRTRITPPKKLTFVFLKAAARL